MAAPRREHRYEPNAPRRIVRGVPGEVRGRVPVRRYQGSKGSPLRAFVVLAVVLVSLMSGSVYVHAVAAGLEGEAARLADEKARAEAEAERLEVKIAELSGPGRIRSLARRELGMRDPNGEDLRTFDGSDGEDMARDVEGEQ